MVNNKSVVRECKLCVCVCVNPDCEFKFEVKKNKKREKVTLELKSGVAEIFGMEMIKGKKYEFIPDVIYTIIVFTW